MRGGTVKSIIGELLGRRHGIAFGKGGSMSVCFLALSSNQGQVFEAFNLAKLWNLPMLFGCEHTIPTMKTRANLTRKQKPHGDCRSPVFRIYRLLQAGTVYSRTKVNGMDILAVKAAVQHGRMYALDGYGPGVLEYVTYVCNHPKSLLLFSDAKIRDMAGIV